MSRAPDQKNARLIKREIALRTNLKKRKRFKSIKKVSDKKILETLTKNLIVVQHYLMRKKTYLEIVSKKD